MFSTYGNHQFCLVSFGVLTPGKYWLRISGDG